VILRFSAVETSEQFLSAPLFQRVAPLARQLDRIWSGSDETAIAQRMSLIAFAIRIASAGIAFLSQVVLARWTGTFEYGIYVFVWTAIIILGNLSCLGFQTAVIRFLPQYRREGDLERLRGILLTSRIFVLLSASIAAAAGIAIVWLLSGTIESYYVLPFVLAFTCLPMIALGDVLDGTARANSWPVRADADLYPAAFPRPRLYGDRACFRLHRDGVNRGHRRRSRDLHDDAPAVLRHYAPSRRRLSVRRQDGGIRIVDDGRLSDLPRRGVLLPFDQCGRADGRHADAA